MTWYFSNLPFIVALCSDPRRHHASPHRLLPEQRLRRFSVSLFGPRAAPPSTSTTSPCFSASSPNSATTSAYFPVSPFLLVDLQRGDRDLAHAAAAGPALAHARDSVVGHDQRPVVRLDRPGGVQHAARALSGAHGAPGEVLRVHARVLEHRVHALSQGGSVLLHVPGRVAAGGEGREGRDPSTAVHRVPPRGHHALLLRLRTPVRGHGRGRADGDSRRECSVERGMRGRWGRRSTPGSCTSSRTSRG